MEAVFFTGRGRATETMPARRRVECNGGAWRHDRVINPYS
jgi:hypothetical protein